MSVNTKSISHILITGTFWSSFFSVFTKVVAGVSTIVVLRKLSLHEFGISELTNSLVSLLSILMLPGLIEPVVSDASAHIGRGEVARAKEILKNFLRLSIILCTIGFVLVFLGSFIAKYFFTENVVRALHIASYSFIVYPFMTYITAIFLINNNFFAQRLTSFLNEFFAFIGIVILFKFTDLRIEAIFLGNFLGQVFALLCILPFFFKAVSIFNGIKETKSLPFYESIKFHGKWAVLSSYMNSFGNNIRIWLIKFFFGTAAVSIFSLAMTLLTHTQSLISFSGLLMQIFSQRAKEEKLMNVLAAKAIKYQVFIFIFVGACCFFFVPIFIPIIFPKYTQSLFIYKVLLLSLIPSAFLIIFGPMFHAKKKQRSIFFSMCLRACITLVCAPVSFLLFGFLGIAFEYIVTLTVSTVERYFSIKRQYPSFKLAFKDFISFDQIDKKVVGKIINRVLPKTNKHESK